jgi:hypothetical protein
LALKVLCVAKSVAKTQHRGGCRQVPRVGRGVKGKPKAIKSRTLRASTGKVTIDLRKVGDAAMFLETLRDVVRQIEVEVEGDESAAA